MWGAHCDEGNGKTVLARFLRIGRAKYFLGKRTFLLCSDIAGARCSKQ
jgi:hypothetical protein